MMMELLDFIVCLVFHRILQDKDLMLWLKSMMNIKIRFIILVGVIHIGYLHRFRIMLRIWLLILYQVFRNIGFYYDNY
jgi:hypothetical protein